jgi:hypothetical protein
MAVIGAMGKSGKINIRSVRFVCDNEAAVKRCNQKQTKSVFHNTEGDWDLVSTYLYLKRQWSDNIYVSVRWFKGHADREGRPLTKYERLNVEVDLLADQIREEAIGIYGARPNCPHWPIEKVTLFMRRKKITSNMKYHLASQLTDPKLRAQIMVKEEWSEHTFDKVDWTVFETAFKRLSKNRKMAVSKSCHNLWHTGKRNGQIYRGKKSCCFCNTEEEYRNHILSCRSLDATMAQEASWAKVKKAMATWKIPPDFWTATEKGLQHYTINAHQNNKGNSAPFPGTFTNPCNLLRQAFREQDEIG